MLTLNNNDIEMNLAADGKEAAIRAIAASLTAKSLVDADYVSGMLAREEQNSTFLGNGIAIPHGTVDTRGLVLKTGVAVHHYPNGVDWGDGNTVYVAIGIAAKSDEHLAILKQLTKVLSDDGVEVQLKSAASAQQIVALLNGESQLQCDFTTSHILQAFPASDMLQLCAVAGGLLKNSNSGSAETVADLVTKDPGYLADGIWLAGTNAGVKSTAMTWVTSSQPFEHNGKPVKALIAIAANNPVHSKQLSVLQQLLADKALPKLLDMNAEQIVAKFTGANESLASAAEGHSAVFKIRNAHGLHARPGAMLVAEAKKFDSSISVENISSSSKAVNAKSLMKVIALGVKHGHELRFTASGPDAEQALSSIGNAIQAGLGEGA
ncbi:fused PTS fructose transporter subunit IIA/HPr protein [Vibrio sp.]|uniref:fused PTS fructose transporter subunit IIA/HPr protein n=1 Tax=Vibrio sp. TaxID=678 RepID=UPI003D11A0F2